MQGAQGALVSIIQGQSYFPLPRGFGTTVGHQ